MAGILLLAAPGCCYVEPNPSDSDLVFNDLATVWDEAMPLGNASVGELVWQKEGNLRLSLDRIDLWDLRPVEVFQEEEYSFEWVKEHVRNKDFDPVIEFFDKKGYTPAPSKIPGAALEVDISKWGAIKENRLFLNNALCSVEWENGISMKTFVQADEDAGWLIFENVPEDFDIQLVPPQYSANGGAIDAGLGSSSLALLGYPQGEVKKEGNRITYHQQGWGDFFYDVAVEWNRKGSKVVAVWSVTSSLSGKNAGEEVSKAVAEGPSKAYKRHLEYWDAYWRQSDIEVPDALIQRQYDREMYKFGSATRKDSYPISLQSVWTADDGFLPPWKGDYHNDLNTQLSYWPSYIGNHLDEGLGYLNTLWNQVGKYKEFTKKFFGKDGMAAPGYCTLEGDAMSGWVQYGFSPTTSAWLGQHFYLHWKYSADKEFLRDRAYPFLKDVAVFLEQETEVLPDGTRTFEFSSSPEIHENSIHAYFPQITNYDLALTRFAFSAAAEMADSLGLTDEASRWSKDCGQLPDYAIDPDGGLSIAPGHSYNLSHRHFSHAMAIHPLGLLDIHNGPEEKAIIDATLARLHANGPDWWCGYSYSWLANMEARAGHGEEAAEALRTFAGCFVLRNSFHANGDQTKSGKSSFTYRPFTLEGNFAYASGLQEMLLQSQSGVIEVFPAVPAEWKDIRFDNLRAIGAFLVSAEMKGGEVVSLSVYSQKGGKLRIRSPKDGSIIERNTSPGETVEIPRDGNLSSDKLTLLVGTYTDSGSKGIYSFRFDPLTGETEPLLVTDVANPSFLAVTPDNKTVYAVTEQQADAAVSGFAYDAALGSLTLKNSCPVSGKDPCHVTFAGKDVVVSNYSSGSMSIYPVAEDGSLGQENLIEFKGNGPVKGRQEASHIHSSQVSPDGKFLFVIDLGGDRIYRYPISDGKVTSSAPVEIKVPAGEGPRHFTFSKDGRFMYVLTELGGNVIAYDYNGGDLKQIQVIEADPLHAGGSADIHFSPDGKFLYASNRLNGDGLAIFSQDPSTGLLTSAGYQGTGIHPRNFTLSPDGRFVLVACRDNDEIQVFSRDSETGLLNDTGKDIKVPHPVCVILTPSK